MIQREEENTRDEGILQTKAIELLGPTTLPIVILTKEFDVLRKSHAFVRLFSDYYNLSIKNFFDIFKASFKPSQLDEVIKSLRSSESGYTWRGTIGHKSSIAKTIFTKLIFFPIYEKSSLCGYFAYFENVTSEFLTSRLTVLDGLLKASKMKDKDTGYHTERVNYYSKLLAKYMYKLHLYPKIINVDFVENIGLYAAMHDIGKIGTPDHILQKPSQLSDDEWKIMQEHTINGAMILAGFELPMAQDIAISHHEWWDGTGYPFRIANKMIPLSARIVAIGDVYDALRTKRPYKEVMSHDETMDVLIAGSEKHFDPELIRLVKNIHTYFDAVWKKLQDKELDLGRVEHM
ncbi:MAG: HD domain-containing protein [Spirochaetaceae bacterium]|nr:HD domain-containing protein [Spirochaetaceae bacterium]